MLNIKHKVAASLTAGVGGALLMAVPASALVQSADLADGAVVTAKIADTAVQREKLAGGSVTTSKLRARAVTTSKLDGLSVVTSKIANGAVTGAKIATNAEIVLDKTRTSSSTGSFQNLAADLTYVGAAGGTSAFHAGVMGHFHGDTLTNTAVSYHAGLVGAYSVTTSDANPGPKAGVVGAVNVDGGSNNVANSGVMAVLDGGDPGEAVTADSAYGVAYINANSSAKFDYGVNLSHVAIGDIEAVSYGKADLRLSNGQEVYTGSATTRNAVRTQVGTQGAIGSIYLSSAGKLYLKVAIAGADTDWQKVTATAAD